MWCGERKHNNDSFFPCNECRLLYRRKDNLYHHLKEKHQSSLQNQPLDINHPDQYYTITKEKGKKMPRLNTESNEYRATFTELKFVDNTVCTCLQQRAGFSNVYPKRKVLADGVSTVPLDI
jgi:hypothetical protein